MDAGIEFNRDCSVVGNEKSLLNNDFGKSIVIPKKGGKITANNRRTDT